MTCAVAVRVPKRRDVPI